MPNRDRDWLNQALQDLEQAEDSRAASRHEWACFAAQQAAEKAVKALHLHFGQEACGHVIAKLLVELPERHARTKGSRGERPRTGITSTSHRAIRTVIQRGLRSSPTVRSRARKPSVMPVRSLNSSVLRWPDARTVDAAVRRWADRAVATHPETLRAGYFGSYARGDWGPGSDLDLIVIVDSLDETFERRAARWDVTDLPVPAEIIVYTSEEWRSQSRRGRFYATVMREAVWVWERAGQGPAGT